MRQQLSTSHRAVAVAAFFLVLTAGVFGASFYLYDGLGYVGDLIAFVTESQGPDAASSTPPATLRLQEGMPEQFALRLWSEQLDSHQMIERLVTGQIESIRTDSVEKGEDEAKVHVTVVSTEGPSTRGVISLNRFRNTWYTATATAARDGATPSPTTRLPDPADVDKDLLNSILSENEKSQDVISEYLDGVVKQVFVEEITPGPNTVTLQLRMEETHGTAYANLVAINKEVEGEPTWFLARFTKTDHTPLSE
jgi:hypothetical protein